jgi:hypothetical protein
LQLEIVCIVYGIPRRLVPVPGRFFAGKKNYFKKIKALSVGTHANGLPGDFKKERGIIFKIRSEHLYALCWNF